MVAEQKVVCRGIRGGVAMGSNGTPALYSVVLCYGHRRPPCKTIIDIDDNMLCLLVKLTEMLAKVEAFRQS